MDYGMRVTVALPFEAARQGIEAALKEEGFGILTEIDVKATLAQKIGVDFDRYTILGACNPTLAYRGLTAERDLGLLLPCNVIVYEGEKENGSSVTTVAIFDPEVGLKLTGNEALDELASEAKTRLERALAAFAASAAKEAHGG